MITNFSATRNNFVCTYRNEKQRESSVLHFRSPIYHFGDIDSNKRAIKLLSIYEARDDPCTEKTEWRKERKKGGGGEQERLNLRVTMFVRSVSRAN